MEAEQQDTQNTFTYRKTGKETSSGAKMLSWDFFTPFAVCTFLTLPSLLIVAIAKRTVGFESLVLQSYFPLMLVIAWILVPVATFCGLLYLWRGRNILARMITSVLLLILLAAFIYDVLPAK